MTVGDDDDWAEASVRRLSVEDMDARCLDFDHNFPWMDLYDDDGWGLPGDGLPAPAPSHDQQMNMKCCRCGETMRESFQRMSAALKDMLVSGGPA